MALRLVLGICAATFLAMGVSFMLIGLLVNHPDSGSPTTFVWLGAAFAAVGLLDALMFMFVSRRLR